jgi:integrase
MKGPEVRSKAHYTFITEREDILTRTTGVPREGPGDVPCYRHTFNTNMRKAGVPESVIMQITGHATREMFDRYNTIDAEDARRAIDQLQDYFQNVYKTFTNQENSGYNEKENIK